MDITVATENGITVAEITGEIDGKTAPAFQEKIISLIAQGGRILLDLRNVPFMSSAGLRVMLLTYRESTAKSAKMVLVGMRDEIRASMSATGFLRFFTACDTREAGMEALR
jgi:anti-sigma B factor antagonist